MDRSHLCKVQQIQTWRRDGFETKYYPSFSQKERHMRLVNTWNFTKGITTHWPTAFHLISSTINPSPLWPPNKRRYRANDDLEFETTASQSQSSKTARQQDSKTARQQDSDEFNELDITASHFAVTIENVAHTPKNSE